MAKSGQKGPFSSKVVALLVTDSCPFSGVLTSSVFWQLADRCSRALFGKFRASCRPSGPESNCLELGFYKNYKKQSLLGHPGTPRRTTFGTSFGTLFGRLLAPPRLGYCKTEGPVQRRPEGRQKVVQKVVKKVTFPGTPRARHSVVPPAASGPLGGPLF